MKILDVLFQKQDKQYADFQYKLTPTIPRDKFIGVRVPIVREIGKRFVKEKECDIFLNSLPHNYYDENMLQSVLISFEKDYDKAITLVNSFLPFVDNWAVCDILSPKAFYKNKDKLIKQIPEWINSNKTYTIRFGIEMLMSHFLDKDFKEEYLVFVSSVNSDEYYVNMMKAWFFATALTKQWDATIYIIENHVLDDWSHNKTIQKAIESYRIKDSQKEYLRKFKTK